MTTSSVTRLSMEHPRHVQHQQQAQHHHQQQDQQQQQNYNTNNHSPIKHEFIHHWQLLKDRAQEVIAESPSNPAHVQLMLNRLTSLLFGLDESFKQNADNALEVIIQLVQSTLTNTDSKHSPLLVHQDPPTATNDNNVNNTNNNVNEEQETTQPITSNNTSFSLTKSSIKDSATSSSPIPILSESISLAALKAIKSCVIRNPTGRTACRAAGVFDFLQSILISHAQDPILVEEAMTTLAAMCLSNDLNALQATMQFRSHVDDAARRFSDRLSLIQKLTYLKALFVTMRREQKTLLKFILNAQEETSGQQDGSFWDHVTFAERALFWLLKEQGEQQEEVQRVATPSSIAASTAKIAQQALDVCTIYTKFTKLLDPLVWNLHKLRASACYAWYFVVQDLASKQNSDATIIQKYGTVAAGAAEITGGKSFAGLDDGCPPPIQPKRIFDHDDPLEVLVDIEYCLKTTHPQSHYAGTMTTLPPSTTVNAQLHICRATILYNSCMQQQPNEFIPNHDAGKIDWKDTNISATMELAKEAFAKALILDPTLEAMQSVATLGMALGQQ